MKFINGTNRNQLPLFASSIDDAIAQDNEIRLIDLFLDSLKLPDFGFTFDFVENGRPAYHPSDLLKFFIYGYLNCMRSSRTLEKECNRNIELMRRIFNLIDQNILKQYLKVLAPFFDVLTALFKAFYGSFYFKNEQSVFQQRILIVV
ncbi:transposase [Flavobacterium sp. LS2P90]|uniref:Transposase n=1 Tax=Flavobacterium xylosi TaxID=3230415 RepID=A0ABW6HX22_9FLAO